MDYEKKYNEALKDMRAIYPNLKGDAKLAVEHAFPELRESEDERIRKAIIHYILYETKGNISEATEHVWVTWLEKQKEQKSIIQDVELNDAVYDYVRDHFIAGADFTPEYIKKLMENAFFAGVDYYLLKQESESCEPDTNVEKVIEDVIRVYGKTQGEWVGGYDVDTLIVNLRRAFNKNEHKPASPEDMPYVADEHFYEQEPVDSFKYRLAEYMTKNCTGHSYNISSESILKMAKEELIKRGELKEQKPVERNKATINGEPIPTENQSVDIPLAEWSEEDENMITMILGDLEWGRRNTTVDKDIRLYDEKISWLKSLRPSWKPSKEQMRALKECGECKRCIKELYEQLNSRN